jgi:hypothetical protein
MKSIVRIVMLMVDLVTQGTMSVNLKKAMVEAIVARGESRFMANIYAFMSGFAPRWKGQASFLGKIFGNYGQKCADDEVKK